MIFFLLKLYSLFYFFAPVSSAFILLFSLFSCELSWLVTGCDMFVRCSMSLPFLADNCVRAGVVVHVKQTEAKDRQMER